jgi:hypothetical protein
LAPGLEQVTRKLSHEQLALIVLRQPPKRTTPATAPPVIPGAIMVTIPQAAAMIGRGTTFIYLAIADGTIQAVKSNKRTLVLVKSLYDYAASLPAAKIKPTPKCEPQRLRKTA